MHFSCIKIFSYISNLFRQWFKTVKHFRIFRDILIPYNIFNLTCDIFARYENAPKIMQRHWLMLPITTDTFSNNSRNIITIIFVSINYFWFNRFLVRSKTYNILKVSSMHWDILTPLDLTNPSKLTVSRYPDIFRYISKRSIYFDTFRPLSYFLTHFGIFQ